MPKHAKAKRDGVRNPQNYNFDTENVDALNATDQPKSIVELGYMCPRGLSGPPAVTLTNVFYISPLMINLGAECKKVKFQMLHYASFPQYNGTRFQFLLNIVSKLYRKSHD